jgi:hypothetical protein
MHCEVRNGIQCAELIMALQPLIAWGAHRPELATQRMRSLGREPQR